MSYQVQLTPKAEKYLKSLAEKHARQIMARLEISGRSLLLAVVRKSRQTRSAIE